MSIVEAPSEGTLEVGSFASTRKLAALPSLKTITVATFNIRYAVGSFLITGSLLRRLGIRRPARRPRLIEHHLSRAADAFSEGIMMPPVDIIALQEADAHTRRAGAHHIAPELAKRLAMHYAFAPMQTPRDVSEATKKWYLDFEEHIAADDEGDTGVALLSRIKPSHVERLNLPWCVCPWRPRLCIHATFKINHTPLHIFNSHIDTHAETDAQLAQHERVLTRAEEFSRRDEPTILLGDFNTLTKRSAVEVRRFLESRGYETPFATGTTTWRAGLIRLHTDWIFTRRVRVARSGVLRPLSVSDHFPVWVTLDTSDF